MKSNIFIITVTCLTMLFASCTTMNVNNVNKGEALKGGWGYVIARVINPTAGNTFRKIERLSKYQLAIEFN